MLYLIPFVPFILGTLILLPRLRRIEWPGLVLAIPTFMMSFYFLTQTGAQIKGGPVVKSITWIEQLGINYSIRGDGLGLLYAFLITFIGGFILLYSDDFMRPTKSHRKFFAYICYFMGSMLGIVLSDSMIQMYIFWELTSLTSFLLIAYDDKNTNSNRFALQALLVTVAGGLCLLAAIILMNQFYGTFSLSAILAATDMNFRVSPFYIPTLILLFIGAFAKSAQFPFHFWLPNAMVAPTPVSAYLHSATMVTAGVYLLSRLSPVMGATNEWSLTLIIVSSITMLLASAQALIQQDLKKILAYTTIAVLAQMIMLIGIGGPVAITASVVLLFAHSLYKANLFMVAGAVTKINGSSEVDLIKGLGDQYPWLGRATALASASMMGIPLFLGFTAKEGLYDSAASSSWLFLLIVFVTNVAMTIIACLFTHRPFFAKTTSISRKYDLGKVISIPIILGALHFIFALLIPQLQKLFINPAASSIYGSPSVVPLHTFPSLSMSFFLSAASILLGLVIYIKFTVIRARVNKFTQRFRLNLAHLHDQKIQYVDKLAHVSTRFFQNGFLRYYVLFVILGIITILGYAIFKYLNFYTLNEVIKAYRFHDVKFYEWVVALCLLAGSLIAVIGDKPLTSILALGLVGINVSVIFVMFGAPDLAMTQLLFETLIVVILVLVVVHLPTYEGTTQRPRIAQILHTLIAIVLGSFVTMTMLTILGGFLDLSLSRYFIENTFRANGTNIVNIILVDFRGFDTLGEILVVATSAFAVFSILKIRRKGL